MTHWTPLRTKIQKDCLACGGSGYVGDELCNCAIKFRVYNRLTRSGFHEATLDLVSSPSYQLPMFVSGAEAVQYFIYNPVEVMEKGLSLYVFSLENGRGKTTLAHYLMYVLLWTFSKTENYSPSRTYAFENVHDMCMKEKNGWEEETWRSTVLVIDDLGTESRSAPWKRDINIAMLHRIMHYRLDHRLPTIITANYAPASLSTFYEGIVDSVLEIRPDGVIGGRVFRQVEVGGGEDFRQMDGNSEWPL